MSNTPELLFDTKSVVGEGPIWDFENHVLYWLDIFGKELHFHDPSSGSHEVRELEELVGTVVCRQSGGLVLALKSGFAFYDVDSEVVTPIVDPESHIPTNHFNDGKCDPAGRLWAGTMPDSEDSPAGGMYRLDADLSVHQMFDNVTISNGICWSSDAKTMYYIDTPLMKIEAFDYDNVTGAVENRRTCCEIFEEAAWPDGMAIDVDDKLWVGHYFGDYVRRWDPETGECIDKIKLPCSNVTACAFGGDNLETLYITTATHALNEEQLAQQPLAGGLFVVDAGVRGQITPKFAG